MNCIVVGAGMIGCSVSWRLAQQGHRVTLVDRATAGSGTSSTTGAWVNANAKRPKPYFDLNFMGMREHRRLMEELEGASWLACTGSIELGAEPAEARRRIADLHEWGYSAEIVGRSDLAELEPDLTPPHGCEQALYFPDESVIYPELLISRLLRESRRLGVEMRFQTRVRRLVAGSARVAGVELATGETILGDVVVTCCGYETPELVRTAGTEIPLVPARETGSPALGFLVVTSKVPVDIRHMVRAWPVSFRPDGAGRLQLHGEIEERSIRWDARLVPPPGEAWSVLDRARALVRNLDGATVASAHIGYRPLPVDGLSAVGWAPGTKGLYVLVTHSGITLGPLLGKLAAAEVNGQCEDILEPFRPDRFGQQAA